MGHFIVKQLAEEFKKQFTCLGENTEKYITFTVPIQKDVTRIDKNGTINPLYHFHLLPRHLDTNRVITAGSSPLHIASSWQCHIQMYFGTV